MRGLNINATKILLKFIVSCECLGLEETFQGSSFGQDFYKAYQFVTTNEKVC
jgi:hypothetical protein